MNQPINNPAFYYPAVYGQPPQPGQPLVQGQPQPVGYPQPYPGQPAQAMPVQTVPVQTAPVQTAPVQIAHVQTAHVQPAGYPPYPQPNYYQPAAYYPAYAQGQAAPGFAITPPKDPRKTGGARVVNWMCLLVLIQIVISFLVGTVLVAATLALGFNIQTDELGMALYTVAMSPAGLLPPFLCYMLAGKKDWNQYFRFENKGEFTSLLMVLAGLGISLAANFPANALMQLLKNLGAADPTENLLNMPQSFPAFWVELVGIAVMVPVVEEFVFRGVVFSSLERFGTGFAVFGSALIFGMAHLNISSVVFATVAGLVMGLAYAKTRNLWVTVSIHALNNGLAVVDEYAELLVGPDQMLLLRNLLMFIPLGLGLVALVLLLILRLTKGSRERRKALAAQQGASQQGEYAMGQETPPLWRQEEWCPAKTQEEAPLSPLGAGESLGCLAHAPSFWCMVAAVGIMLVSMFL